MIFVKSDESPRDFVKKLDNHAKMSILREDIEIRYTFCACVTEEAIAAHR